jgi:TonB family protein
MTYFGTFNGALKSEVQFVIRRDGSVDPASIRLVTSSGNYSFDQRALAAVEAAANAKKFGALPGPFREDILPVTFWFSPQIIR